ncbi:hypothetical protein [Natrinema sp. H-ect4]|uniref:hypothetical protein n=1 Tax=Natrinema sp. H-ect4 TaxID=3242699 RepID=UPI0035A8694F
MVDSRRSLIKRMSALGAVSFIGSASAQSDSSSGVPIKYVKKDSSDPVTEAEISEVRKEVVTQVKSGSNIHGISTQSAKTSSPDKVLVNGDSSSEGEIVTGYAMSMVNGKMEEQIVRAPKRVANNSRGRLTVQSSSSLERADSSIDKFVEKEKRKAGQKEGLSAQSVTTAQTGGQTEPRGNITQLGTINSQMPVYDFEPPVRDYVKVGQLQLSLSAFEVNAEDGGYFATFNTTQVPSGYSKQEGESTARNDYTWSRQYWNKTELGLDLVSKWAPDSDITKSIDTQLNIGGSFGTGGGSVSAGLSADVNVPAVTLDEKSDPGETVEHGYQYHKKPLNPDSMTDHVTYVSLAHAYVNEEDPTASTCTPPVLGDDDWGTTLLEAEMKGKFDYKPHVDPPHRVETTGDTTIDGRLGCF